MGDLPHPLHFPPHGLLLLLDLHHLYRERNAQLVLHRLALRGVMYVLSMGLVVWRSRNRWYNHYWVIQLQL